MSYGYDTVSELKTALGSGGQSTENLGYLYDPAWNLNKRTNSGSVTTFTLNNLNQVTSDGTNTYAYDWNGNLVSKTWGSGSVTYTWDDENQLASGVTDTYYTPTGSRWWSQFVYDGRQRLRRRLDYTWNPYTSGWSLSADTRYIYDGMLVVQERNGSNVPLVSYTRGTDLSGTLDGAGGIGGLLARSHGYSSGSWTNHNMYHADGNGNVTAMVGANQSLVASYRYDPYGQTTYSYGSLATANVYRFSSKPIHVSSGLYYYSYRFYSPELQRWVNRDPIAEHGGPNLYGFEQNDSVNGCDLFGLVPHTHGTFTVGIDSEHYSSSVVIRYNTGVDSNGCPECERPKLVQIAQSSERGLGMSILHSSAWFLDTDRRSSPFYPHQQTSYGFVVMDDKPGSTWYNFTRWVWGVTQSFEVCAVCTDPGKERVLGCVSWGHDVAGIGPSTTWGAGEGIVAAFPSADFLRLYHGR